MSTLEAILLGLVQGLTEFLPVSSSGHLRILPAMYGGEDPGAAFTAIVQLGTMAAELVYFRFDIARIARATWRSVATRRVGLDVDARLGWFILIGTVPISIFGLALADSIETGARNLTLIGSMLILFGLVLFAAEKVGKRTRPLERIRTRDGLIMGFAQALALVPGVSRSGATISAGLFLGLDRVAAARFSFLLSIPAVVLSGGLQLFSLLLGEGDASGADPGWAAIAVATVLAFFAGYATIAFLLRYLVTHSVNVFVVYRIALGTLVLVLVGTGAIA
ncbi:MAG: undecaprenyl-diphosphate phosphatase [Solirubrobacterales bacterium]|nr:undecaprenyl-diphosphate phosphatase [Solirubrobacterales bacterium]